MLLPTLVHSVPVTTAFFIQRIHFAALSAATTFHSPFLPFRSLAKPAQEQPSRLAELQPLHDSQWDSPDVDAVSALAFPLFQKVSEQKKFSLALKPLKFRHSFFTQF